MVWLSIFTVWLSVKREGWLRSNIEQPSLSQVLCQVKLEQDLSWETISDTADFLSLCIFHKISLHKTRPLICSCMPKLHNKTVNTRSSNKYVEFKFQNDLFNKSFFPFVTKLLLQLRSHFEKFANMDDFKVDLKLKYKSNKLASSKLR